MTPSSPAISSSRIPISILLIGLLLVVNLCVALLWPSSWTAITATLLFTAMVVAVFRANPVAMMLLMPFALIYIPSMVSMAAIEGGGFMKEMGRRGAPSPASAAFAVYTTMFVLTAATVLSRFLRRFQGGTPPLPTASLRRPFILGWGAVAVAALAIVYLVLVGLSTGFPLFTGMDRFQFRRLHGDPLTLSFLNLKFLIALILGTGAAFAENRLQRNIHHATFALYLLVSFMFGDKFFIILNASVFYSMPLLLKNPLGLSRQIMRQWPAALLVLLCVASVTLFIYSEQGNLSAEATLKRVSERITGQGQLWYLSVEDASHWFSFDTDAVLLNLQSLLANPAADFAFKHKIAAFYFVEKYAPTAMYHSFLTNQGTVTPTLAFEAYVLVLFGHLGVLAAVLTMGCVAGVLLSWLARACMSGNPFNVLLPAYVCSQLISFMSQGTLYSILGLSAFKGDIAFLLLQLVMGELVKPRRALQRSHA